MVTRKSREFESLLTSIPLVGETQSRFYAADSDEGESIGRLEFNWGGWQSQTVQFGAELVHNFLDSEAILLYDDGSFGH